MDTQKRYERCIYCGLKWNVSVLDETPWYEYECPVCEVFRKKLRKTKQKQKSIKKRSKTK